MQISLYGLLFAALFLVAALAQWGFLRKVLVRGLEAERANIPASEFAQRMAKNEKLLKAVLWFDLLVLPSVGYYAGTLMFSK